MRHNLALAMQTARFIRMGVLSSAGLAGLTLFGAAANSRCPVVEAGATQLTSR